MTRTAIDPAAETALADIEAALDALARAVTRGSQHERLLELAGVNLDRTGASMLRMMAICDSSPRLGHLAEKAGVDATFATRKIQQLEREGLVARDPDPDDRRASRLRLTAEGARVNDRLLSARRKRLAEVLAGWPDDDRREFARLIRRFADDITIPESTSSEEKHEL